jgi:hypothetical protein
LTKARGSKDRKRVGWEERREEGRPKDQSTRKSRRILSVRVSRFLRDYLVQLSVLQIWETNLKKDDIPILTQYILAKKVRMVKPGLLPLSISKCYFPQGPATNCSDKLDSSCKFLLGNKREVRDTCHTLALEYSELLILVVDGWPLSAPLLEPAPVL